MKIVSVGGGPGGLYAALLLKKADPSREVMVIDRNPPATTYGWGVVFSDETLGFLADSDPESHAEIAHQFVHWDAIDIFYRDELIRSGGHAFSGLARHRLLSILQERCRSVGVKLYFEKEIEDVTTLVGTDVVIAADGMNSRLRAAHAGVFMPTFDVHPTKYIWFGAYLPLAAFTFVFRETTYGMFKVHAYPFEPGVSTFIVECNEPTWKRAGLDSASDAESLRFCQELFDDVLSGRPLLSNRSTWLNFVTVRNRTWHDGNMVLLGDAAHTAHFSIGSGTKIAMEDAIALAHALDSNEDRGRALVEYEVLRQPVVERTQQAARDSSLWFEHMSRYSRFAPLQFAFSLLTRSKRITYDNLRLRDSGFAIGVDAWFASQSASPTPAASLGVPPLSNPFLLGDSVVRNRIVRMCSCCDGADEGMPGDRHFDALRAAALGGAGLVLAGDVAVALGGRVTSESAGIFSESAATNWRRIVDDVHAAGTLIGIQISHAGPRGATRPRREGTDLPLAAPWPLRAASAIAYSPFAPVPQPVNRAGMALLRDEFVDATLHALAANFDVLELDFSHGYLPATFLSPLTNQRDDEFGGCLQNRLRFPLEVLSAVRATWPYGRPLSISFSAADWAAGGMTIEDAITIARSFRDRGCDLIHVVSGQTTFRAAPPYGRTWETPLADAVRNEVEIPVLLGGTIRTAEEANTILAAGRADLCLFSPSAEQIGGTLPRAAGA